MVKKSPQIKRGEVGTLLHASDTMCTMKSFTAGQKQLNAGLRTLAIPSKNRIYRQQQQKVWEKSICGYGRKVFSGNRDACGIECAKGRIEIAMGPFSRHISIS